MNSSFIDSTQGNILGMGSVYFVILSLTGWAHTRNDLPNHSGNMGSVNERQHYLKPPLNLAGPYPEWSLQPIDSCCHSIIYCTWLHGCILNPAFGQLASKSGPQSRSAMRSTALHLLLLPVQESCTVVTTMVASRVSWCSLWWIDLGLSVQ